MSKDKKNVEYGKVDLAPNVCGTATTWQFAYSVNGQEGSVALEFDSDGLVRTVPVKELVALIGLSVREVIDYLYQCDTYIDIEPQV